MIVACTINNDDGDMLIGGEKGRERKSKATTTTMKEDSIPQNIAPENTKAKRKNEGILGETHPQVREAQIQRSTHSYVQQHCIGGRLTRGRHTRVLGRYDVPTTWAWS